MTDIKTEIIDRIVWHCSKTPEAALELYYRVPLGETENVNCRNGDSHSVDSVLAGIHKAGVWGYLDYPNRTVYYWRDTRVCSDATMIEFMAHELMHAVILATEGMTDNDLRDEYLCDGAGAIAALLHKRFCDNRKRGAK